MMSNSLISDQQIVHALSTVEVPDELLRRIDLKGIVNVVDTASQDVQKNTADLERARNELKEGWWIGNWWNNRGEKVEDLQFSLQKSVGNLTDKTAQLLIFNTAISRELNKQQKTLLDQQVLLKQQTLALERQNNEIFGQQKELELQQQKITAANQGLLEAKGVTAEQAIKLIGCVLRVEAAELKMDESNQRVLKDVSEKILDISDEVADNNARLAEQIFRMTAQVDSQNMDTKQHCEALNSKTSDEMNALSKELRLQMDEHLSATAEAILESARSMRNALERAADVLSASIQENHSSANNSMEVLSNVQNAERSRLEIAFGAQVASIRDDFGRRSKLLFNALVVVSCITLATAGVQIFGYMPH